MDETASPEFYFAFIWDVPTNDWLYYIQSKLRLKQKQFVKAFDFCIKNGGAMVLAHKKGKLGFECFHYAGTEYFNTAVWRPMLEQYLILDVCNIVQSYMFLN